MESSSPLAPGEILDGKYEILGVLGSGAMGVVFDAQHRLLGKRVAVKVLRPELSSNEDLRNRFEAEARAAAAVGHPNIIAVTDMGRTDSGAVYFVMDRLSGETLGDRLVRKGRLEAPTAVAVAREILAGLGAAHELGLVHRDLKPDNIFLALSPGGLETAKILDFGVAKALAAAGRRAGGITQVGLAIGTPEYMAPEQARGEADIDGRADIYAVGVMLYRMLSGRLPFSGETAVAVLTALLIDEPPPLASVCPEAPAELVAVVECAMSRDRSRRPASAADLQARLLAAIPGHPASPSLIPPSPPSPPSPGGAGPIAATEGMAGLTIPDRVSLADIDELDGGSVAAHRAAAEPAWAVDPFREAAPGGGPLELGRPLPEPQDPKSLSKLVKSRAAKKPRYKLHGGHSLAVSGLALFGLVTVSWIVAKAILNRSPGPAVAPATFRPLGTDDAVLVEVDISPKDSRLFLDGDPLESNPVRLQRSGKPRRISALADGFQSAGVEFRPDRPKTVRLKLKPARRTTGDHP